MNAIAFKEVIVTTDSDGNANISGMLEVVNASSLSCSLGDLVYLISISDGEGNVKAMSRSPLSPSLTFNVTLQVDNVSLWTIHNPSAASAALYSLNLTLTCGPPSNAVVANALRSIAFRSIEARSSDGVLAVNGRAVFLRGVLDWGWDAVRVAPTYNRQQALAMIKTFSAIGFGFWKLCLMVPDDPVFDVADEVGLPLWLEMPLWQPTMSPSLESLALAEYEAVFARLHHHPSIAVLSLGCELAQGVTADFLNRLAMLARKYFPDVILEANSGSAEAYGGALTAESDVIDYHFYTDPHWFKLLVDHFTRSYLPNLPWLYGEFCDADTLRDFARPGPSPWWLTQPTELNVPEIIATRQWKERLAAAGVSDGGAHLTAIARKQSTAIRQRILELVRSVHATGGYVLTGWRDTPVSTSGVVDDSLKLKYDPKEWLRFNSDRVLVLDRERRREWVRGGDRPEYLDPRLWWSGDTAVLHFVLSNGASTVNDATLLWKISSPSSSHNASSLIASGKFGSVGVNEGKVSQVGLAMVALPSVSLFTEFVVETSLVDESGNEIASNMWPIWVVPNVNASCPSLVTSLSDDVISRALQGEQFVVALPDIDPRFSAAMPFWRESIHVFNTSHPLWIAARLPPSQHADMKFFSIASDFALSLQNVTALLGSQFQVTSAWRRFDAREMWWNEYVIEARVLGNSGRIVISTLRFAGGLGAEPIQLTDNPMGSWLLSAFCPSSGAPLVDID